MTGEATGIGLLYEYHMHGIGILSLDTIDSMDWVSVFTELSELFAWLLSETWCIIGV